MINGNAAGLLHTQIMCRVGILETPELKYIFKYPMEKKKQVGHRIIRFKLLIYRKVMVMWAISTKS